MSWYSSWFTSLPAFDFAVPSSIQRRFFSFLLRRTLGHFLKPGQLDLHQIDSQLGSGTVQVKDLELDGQAINQLLVGLPITLYDGFISGVTARIPFPNPLSSTVGCHVQSLNLTFQITPEHPISSSFTFHNSSNLADSVVSVAETFIHDELTPREEATLRQTLKPSPAPPPLEDESENLPGGFNPFGYNAHDEETRKDSPDDNDPAGVSVFATLIERLLAKFEFSAVDTKITVVYPEQASFTLSVAEIIYRTDSPPGSEGNTRLQSAPEGNFTCGQSRTVSISGLKVTSRDLRVVSRSPPGTGTLSPVSSTVSRTPSPLHSDPPVGQLSCNSSSSSLDEDTQLMMSQSIALLPSDSLYLSTASSSMYQSAISTGDAHPTKLNVALASLSVSQVVGNHDNAERNRPQPQPSMPRRSSVDEVLLSFGSQPIVFSLQTPSRHTQPSEQALQDDAKGPSDSDACSPDKPEDETFQLSVAVGILACAFRSRDLRLFLDIVEACVSRLPTPSRISRKEASPELPRTAFCLEANIVVRGIVIIALPEPVMGESCSLDTFYERPHVPPRLPCAFLRLFLDALSVSSRFSMSLPDTSMPGAPRISSSGSVDRSTSAKLVISDVSLFTFHAVSSLDDAHNATPILITDHYLPMLHVARHYRPSFTSERPQKVELPVFEVADWTQAKLKGSPAKLSTWRSRNRTVSGRTDRSHTPTQRLSDLPSPSNPFITSPPSAAEEKLLVSPAIEVSGRLPPSFPSKEHPLNVDVRVAPLHLFVDLGTILKDNLFVHFVDDIASAAIFTTKKGTDIPALHHEGVEQMSDDDVDAERDVEIKQMSFRERKRAEERKRLEALVLEDLDLGMDYQHTGTLKPRTSQQKPAPRKRKKMELDEPGYTFSLTCSMIRVEIRCPPPPLRAPRSGCMLFDLRGLTICNRPLSTKSSVRFSEERQSHSGDSISNVILNVRLQEILAAYSTVGDNMASVILVLGFLPTQEIDPFTSVLWAAEAVPDTLPLSVVLERPNIMKERLSVTVNIPLVNFVIDKVVLDGIQCWADDVAQLIERTFVTPDSATEIISSHDPSLIGSRYFTQLRRGGTQSSDEVVREGPSRQNIGGTVVRATVAEVLIRLVVPRDGGFHYARPLDVSASDISALLELNPEGKEENIITAKIMDLRVADTSSSGEYTLLLQNPARGLSSAPRHALGCRLTSFVVPGTIAKESRIKLSLWGFTVHVPLDVNFANDLAVFAKAPPGVFESVVPSECTRLTVGAVDVSVYLRAMGHPGAAVLHLDEVELSTELAGNSSESAFKLSVVSSHFFLVDSIHDASESTGIIHSPFGDGLDSWKRFGYALVAEIAHSHLTFRTDNAGSPPNINVLVERFGLRIHLCADTISALTGLIAHLTHTPKDNATADSSGATSQMPNHIIGDRERDMTASLDQHAFRVVPEVGSMADMISDDLPANQDYLDASFGAAAGLRELRDDDLDDFDLEEQTGRSTPVVGQLGIVSNVGGETIRILKLLSFNEHYFDTISPDTARTPDSDTTLRARIHNADITLFLYDGFDWPRTRKIIEKEVKEMRKRLARIRQLVSTGQTQEPIEEATSATLFNSFHIGLERDLENMDPDTLIAAIDDELNDPTETATESSWQSLHPASPGRPRVVSARVHGKRLTRSKGPSIEIRLQGLNAEIDNYRPGETLVSRTLILVKDLEILDHIKTSTWKKFLTDMRSDSRGNVRETDSNMARIELLGVRPSPSHPAEEARLRVKILPLRLHVDQDALDFFKKFFAFQDPESPAAPEDGEKKQEIYFQHAEVFPVDVKLDYKPRRVDYKALRDGKTIELMNFFHFDGAEMTLRHLTLHGITGWPRFFDTLNDLWTPDVKATQLVDFISGVAPIRSVVNVGSGVADLVLLPIAQYKKDGRIVRGLQKGTKAFVQSTAMEAIKLGARLATGTQVILEQAENVLGGQFKDSVTAEALHIPYEDEDAEGLEEDRISRYAAQPAGLKEGVQSAYRSLQRNLHSAAQTILAVPMEVYERSGHEGAVRAVVRAVPIAVLKPMIGASEAVSKTLMGLHNTLDPNIRYDNEAKYKHR